MTSPITSATAAAATSGAASTSGASAATASDQTSATRAKGNDLDREAFLKLLVAQLKYQDPNSPVDTSQFMSQTAQLTMVDKLSAMEASQQKLLLTEVVLGATSLVGRTVSYQNDQGETITGVVSSASFTGSSPILRVGNMDVPLSSVMEVRNPAS